MLLDLVLDHKVGVDDAPLLFNLPNDGAGRTGDLQLLETAGEAAALTPEGPVEVDHLLPLHVRDVHVEGPHGAAALPGAAVSVLFGVENLLAEGIEPLVFVCCLEASEGLQDLHFLFDEQLVHHGEVLEARRTPGWRLSSSHRSPHLTSHAIRLLHYRRGCQ